MKIINHEANGLQIGQRHEDGYINLTKMAQANGKKINDYLRLETTKAFIDELSIVTGIPVSKIIQVRRGRGDLIKQGTWGHPQVAINCAQWCSAKFAVLVSDWVVQWMTTGNNPIPPQPTPTHADISSALEELEKLIISIRSHSRTIHTGAHQPVDPILFKSLHTLSHNQLGAINAAIQHLEMLKRIAEMNTQTEPTPPDNQQTINYLSPSPSPARRGGKPQELTNINIKIPSSQRQWLADTARMVRQNNTKPVPPAERVYPQHLVSIAIQLLQNTSIDIEAAHSLRLEQNEPPATINIKISRQQQQWLTDTAQTIRHNSQQPTTPNERIYPQHLVGIAIQLLQNSSIDIEAAHSIRLEQNEPPATINIKISRQQQQWLTDTAKTIRSNSQQPTCPNERIYPQHLISIAIELLQNAGVNWYRVGNLAAIKQGLITAPFQIKACIV